MPPPMPNPSKRFTANPLKPTKRYRPGKAVAQEESSEEEEPEEDSEAQRQHVQTKPANGQRRQLAPRAAVVERKVEEDEEGFVTDEEDEEAGDKGGATVAVRPTGEESIKDEASIGSEEEEDEDEEESSEEESSSEDEPQRKFQRPTFIKKVDRKPAIGATDGTTGVISAVSNGMIQDDNEEARRKAMADLMIKDKLEKDAAARAAGKKNWDDDDEVVGEDVIDDTDGLDPDAELAAWKVRELKRLKRDRQAIEEREREVEERERRAKLTVAEREAEDAERIAKQKEDREDGRGQASFMQRYHHKGAFFQDDETAEMLRKRDLMGARYEDEIVNREALPEHMRNLRDMSKLGKKSNTRYKDMRAEDTGRWGDHLKQDRRYGEAGLPRDVDEKFQPDRNFGGNAGPTGANASFVKDRRKRSRSPSFAERDKRPRVEPT